MSSESSPEKLVAKPSPETQIDHFDSVRATTSLAEHSPTPTISAENAAATKRLEQSKTIPPLTIDRPGDTKKDWTVAIHLAASVPGGPEQPLGFGVDHQLKELKALAKETEGKSVSYIIHADRPLDGQGNPCVDKRSSEDASACIKKTTDENGPVVTERYYAHDGKLERLSDVHYKSADADLVALLKETQKLAPANNLQLILQSHGMGAQGIQANQGLISLGQMNRDIAAGLKGSGKDKIDLLNFDSCNMAEAAVLDASKKVARDVVASSAEEQTTPKGGGQDISAGIRTLMSSSKINAVELGNRLVDLARSGVNGEGDESGTTTLANFDLSKQDQFKAKLDQLGHVLADSVKGSAEFRVLLSTVDKVTIPETGEYEYEKHNRDLKSFSQHLLDDVQSGKLTTNSAQIEKAAHEFITAYDAFASNQFGDKQSGYDKDGGMTVFLPGSEILDGKQMVHFSSPLYSLDKTMKDNTDPNQTAELADREYINEKLTPIVESLSEMWHAKGFAEGDAIDKGWYDIQAAKTSADINRAYKHFQQLTNEYQSGEVGRRTEAMMLKSVRRVQHSLFSQPQESVVPGWDRFIKTMEDKSE